MPRKSPIKLPHMDMVRAWQSSSTVEEALTKVPGITRRQLITWSSVTRRAGVDLKRYNFGPKQPAKRPYKAMKKLAAELAKPKVTDELAAKTVETVAGMIGMAQHQARQELASRAAGNLPTGHFGQQQAGQMGLAQAYQAAIDPAKIQKRLRAIQILDQMEALALELRKLND